MLLPNRWRGHVRSAVIHAVAMASVAFTETQARAEHHFDAGARLKATNDRLHRGSCPDYRLHTSQTAARVRL